MSLQKIGKYTEILINSRNLIRPTEMDIMRVSYIQHIAIAGLIESGAPFTAEEGKVIIDTGMEYLSVYINDIYPYLSKEGQMKVIIENSKHAELPPPAQPDQSQYENTAQSQYEQYQQPQYEQPQYEKTYQQPQYQAQEPQNKEEDIEDLGEYQTEASKKQERRENPADALMSDLEDYDSRKIETPESKLYTQQAKTDQQQVQQQQDWNTVPQENNVQESYQHQASQDPYATFNQPLDNAASNDTATDVLKTETSYSQGYTSNQATPGIDIATLNKEFLTYERCKLEIQNVSDGSVYRFTVHACPLTEVDDGRIIVRIKQLGKNNKFIQTSQGREVIINFYGIMIHAAKQQTTDGSFAVMYWLEGSEYTVNKLDPEYGGRGGNLVIYDENLEIRVYPVPNVKDNNTGKMLFGNNARGEAAYMYYVKTEEGEIASSVVEREPKFNYEGTNFIIRARWNYDEISIAAEEEITY